MDRMNFIISFPRSGQHLVAGVMEYITKGHDLEFSYCDFYSCCKSIPCQKGSIFMKNHDMPHHRNNIRVPIDQQNKYLVLYRKDPILQLEAYARYLDKKTLEEVISSIRKSRAYYNKFVEKWVDTNNNNILVFDYYELLASPVENMKTIFQHFYPSIQPKPEVFGNIMSHTFLIDNGKRQFLPRQIEVPRTMNPVYYQQLLDSINSIQIDE